MRTSVLFVGLLISCFELLMISVLGLKVRMDSLTCRLPHLHSLDATPADLFIGGSNGRRQGQTLPQRVQSLSFSRNFHQKKLQSNPTLGVGAPLKKILDPPLILIYILAH